MHNCIFSLVLFTRGPLTLGNWLLLTRLKWFENDLPVDPNGISFEYYFLKGELPFLIEL